MQLQQSFADVPGEANWSWLMQNPCGSWIVEHQESLGICALQQCLVQFAAICCANCSAVCQRFVLGPAYAEHYA